MQQILSIAWPLLAVIAWALTVALVVNLLGGVFDERSCQTVCFQILYWSALACAAVGFVGSLWYGQRKRFTPVLIISAVAMFVLLGILLVTALIGNL